MNIVSEWIYNLFLSTGYSAREFSRICGFSENQLKKWCDGKTCPYWRTLIRIGIALGVSIPKDVEIVARQWQSVGRKNSKKRKEVLLDSLSVHKVYCNKKKCEWANSEHKCIMPKCMKIVITQD